MRRLMGLMVVSIVAALLVTSAAEAKGAKNLFGLNYVFKEINAKDAQMLKKSGAKTVRWQMQWTQIEPTPGHFNWSVPDKLVGDLAAKGIRVLPIMWRSPQWVQNCTKRCTIKPPLSSQHAKDAWQEFLRRAVKRYGPNGEFWKHFKKEHHHKNPQPIKTWEIWNEPNLATAMAPPSPHIYANLLQVSKSAIKGVDRHADVMFGGLLAHSPSGPTAAKFLDGVYDQPGAKKAFDIAAIHAYAASTDDMLDEVHGMRRVMNRNGDDKTPIWIAEIGWGSAPSNPANHGQTKGLEGQKKILKHSFKALKKKRKRWNIKKVLWFNYRDFAGSGNPAFCAYCGSAGLLRYDYSPKPAWGAFRRFTH